MNEGGGQKIFDSSLVNNGSLVNGAIYKAAQRGQCISFDGINDYAIGTKIINTTKVTISVWVYITSYPTGTDQWFVCGFLNGIDSDTNDKDIFIDASGHPIFYIFDGSGTPRRFTSTSSVVIPLNTWVHIAATSNDSNMYLYLNGVLYGSNTTGASFAGYTVPNIYATGRTGTPAATSRGIYMPGYIMDYKIWNRALLQNEVQQLYSQPYCIFK